MKTTLKDSQISLRLNSEMLEDMKLSAKSENISLSDYITRLHQDRKKGDSLETRLESLEKVVYSR
jgi:predicted CopG family antitoxin